MAVEGGVGKLEDAGTVGVGVGVGVDTGVGVGVDTGVGVVVDTGVGVGDATGVGVVVGVGSAVGLEDEDVPLVLLVLVLLADELLPDPQANVPIVRQVTMSHSTLGRKVFFIWTPVSQR